MTKRISAAIALAAVMAAGGAQADKIKNPTAVFSGLDKITGRIISFEASVDETIQFGALQMTPRICYTRPPTENPQTTAFVEVEELALDSKSKRLFSGWIFAASPGLHGIEHPVYDIWLVDCKGGTEVIVEAKDKVDDPIVADRPERPQRRQAEEQPRQAPRPAPPQAPRQRFFPTNTPTIDPAGSGNR